MKTLKRSRIVALLFVILFGLTVTIVPVTTASAGGFCTSGSSCSGS